MTALNVRLTKHCSKIMKNRRQLGLEVNYFSTIQIHFLKISRDKNKTKITLVFYRRDKKGITHRLPLVVHLQAKSISRLAAIHVHTSCTASPWNKKNVLKVLNFFLNLELMRFGNNWHWEVNLCIQRCIYAWTILTHSDMNVWVIFWGKNSSKVKIFWLINGN